MLRGKLLVEPRTFGRAILVTSGVSKKTLTKSHGYSRLFPEEKRRLKPVEKQDVYDLMESL